MIHASLVCRGCSGTLYAVSTICAPVAPTPTWEVDHDHTPEACPLRPLLPLEGVAAHVHELPEAAQVLSEPA
ncbi:hypothetical protein [Streptomyces sp. NBC_01294]|uniref:hypothetical protein n=1 Tax=Streptomyces sp. NBC_01294 TaxID=2903815 RepID=UPI002DD95557|nr:hypothetical protein [Streptomyces sp. NBC_01294]WRZ58094.1 hypothetical protein OG534_17265 [Streptomyces sp. NBC_01294]